MSLINTTNLMVERLSKDSVIERAQTEDDIDSHQRP